MSDKKDQDDLSSVSNAPRARHPRAHTALQLTELSDHEEERKQDQDDLFSVSNALRARHPRAHATRVLIRLSSSRTRSYPITRSASRTPCAQQPLNICQPTALSASEGSGLKMKMCVTAFLVQSLFSQFRKDHVVQPSRRKKPRVPTSPAVRRSSRAGKLRQPKGKHRRDSESASNYSDQDIGQSLLSGV
jgi:hypothetical protein